MKWTLKKALKRILNVTLSAQLALMPYYGYGTEPNSILQSAVQTLQNSQDPNDLQTAQMLMDLEIAIEQDKVQEFLQKHPLLPKEVDYFLISDQKVEAIEWHFDTEKQKPVENVSQTVLLNDYRNRPIYLTFKDVQFNYNKESKTVILEGMSEGTVRLRQYIPDIDIIDYIEEKKGEFLIILDRNKGLLVIDMLLAKHYLGSAPVPVFQIPGSVSKTLSELAPSQDLTEQNIHIELIHRGARPPDIIVEEIKSIDKTFDGKDMVFAGDLMISYIDPQGQKHLVQFLKREEIKSIVARHYEMLDSMTKVLAPHLMEQKDLSIVQKELTDLINENPEALRDHILSTIFNKTALLKLKLFAEEGIQLRIKQNELTEENLKQLSKRDQMTFNEWQEFFQKTNSQVEQVHNKNETHSPTQKLPANRQKSPFRTTDQLATGLTSDTPEEKKSRIQSLKIIAYFTKKIKQNRRTIITVLAGGAGGVGVGMVAPEFYLSLFYKMTAIFNEMAYESDFSGYKLTAYPHGITMLFLIPLLFCVSIWSFNPVVRWLSKHAPEQLRMGNKVYHPQGYFKDVLNKWESVGLFKKFIALGSKWMAFLANPIWNRVLHWGGGQPHVMSAYMKGLSPFDVIDPQSDVGEKAQIQKPTSLGFNWPPQWAKSNNFDKKRELQNIAQAKEHIIERIAWQLAVLAVAGKENVTPDQILTYGIIQMNLEDGKKVYGDLTLRMELINTITNLTREIKLLNEVDIRRVTNEIPPELIVRYYEKAKEIAKKAKEEPYFFKKTRSFWNTGRIGHIKQALSLKSIAHFNQDIIRLLNQVPTDFVAQRSAIDFFSDHWLVVAMPIFMTDRANLSLEHIYQMAINENNKMSSGWPHIYDLVLNTYGWLMLSGPSNTLVFAEKAKMMEHSYESTKSIYAPLESYTNTIEPRTQTATDFFKNQFLNLLPGDDAHNKGTNEHKFGKLYFKTYIAGLRFLQFGILVNLITRWGTGLQTATEAFYAWALMNLSQFWYLAWPWMITQGGDKLNSRKIENNIKEMEELKITLSRVARGLYSDNQTRRADLNSAIQKLKSLYREQEWKTLQKNNPALSMAIDNHTNIKEVAETYFKVLLENPPLPNKKPVGVDWLWSSLFASLVTTYLGVQLFINTFDSNKLTGQNILWWGGVQAGLLFSFYLIYKKSLPEHLKYIREVASREGRTARIEKLKHELKDWKKAINSLKSPDERWRHYFYEKVLNIKSDVSQKCMRVFSKTKK